MGVMGAVPERSDAIEGVKIDEDGDVLVDRLTLRNVDFSRWPAKRWDVVGSTLERCTFERLRADDFCFGAGMGMSEYVDCSFDGSRIRTTVPGRARFVRCSFRNVNLTKWEYCGELEFIDCVFTGTLRDIVFVGEILLESDKRELGRERNKFAGNDFSGAKLVDVAFRRGIDLGRQRLPDGRGYLLLEDAEPVLLHALERLRVLPESEEKEEVRIDLQVSLDDVKDGQQQILISPDSFTSKSGVRERAFAMLSELVNEVEAERVAGTLGPVGELRERLSTRPERGGRFVYFRAAGAGAARQVLAEQAVVADALNPVLAAGIDTCAALGYLVAIIRNTRWHPELATSMSLWPPHETAPRSWEEYEELPEDSPWKTPGPSLEQLGEDVRDTLAGIADSELPIVAARWAASEPLAQYSDTTAGSVQALLTDLVTLARRAQATREWLYCLHG